MVNLFNLHSIKMRKNKRFETIRLFGNSPLIGQREIRFSKKKRTRTSATYSKKLNRLKSFYERLAKKKGKFFEKYPTFEKFLEKITLKKPQGG